MNIKQIILKIKGLFKPKYSLICNAKDLKNVEYKNIEIFYNKETEDFIVFTKEFIKHNCNEAGCGVSGHNEPLHAIFRGQGNIYI